MSLRTRLRVAGMALATLTGFKKMGLFIPYRHAESLSGEDTAPPYPAIEAAFAACSKTFLERLRGLDRYRGALEAIGAARPPAPRWSQDWFPRLDAAMAYTMVRERRPARILEIGSGHSTRFLARAVAEGELGAQITAIDPAPRADLEGLPITFHRTVLQDAPQAPFEALEAGDLLLIDSSHLLLPGSDVDRFFNRILPALPRGLILHVHDVFLPDGYPDDWAWRGYGEQLALIPLILGGRLKPIFASHYVATRHAGELAESFVSNLPLVAGARESGLWLEIT